MFIIGYKALNEDFTNRYGTKYEIGTIYQALGEIKWGNNGNGFHICTNFEECFRYVDSNNFILTEVIGFGKLIKYDDEYNGYFDMYVCENMRIIRTISRKEIIEMAKSLYEERLCKFISTFNKINEEFKKVFTTLFRGGNAHLELTDPNNLLETGIEILAQPPGKKLNSTIAFSGGERALTAISLLFSILNVKTVPFVILDEVEAALDEANVDIFGKYLETKKDKSQFIIITHKKKTMEYADVLYGITMQEEGVSKLVSVKLDDK